MTIPNAKPRAGEHTPNTAEGTHYNTMRQWLDERDALRRELDALAAQNRELVEALTYCEISTRADGQWADQSVHTFLLSVLAKHGR